MNSPLVDKALAWTGRVLKVDAHYLVRGTFWSSLSQVVITLSALALSIVLSRHLPKEAYGEYKYVLSLISILSVFTLSGLGASVLQSAARGFDHVLTQGFRTSLRWSAAVFLGALAIAFYYFFNDNYRLALGVLIGGSLAPFIAASGLASNFLVAKKDFRALAFHGSIPSAFFPAAALMITALITQNPLAFVVVYFISNALTYGHMYRYASRKYRTANAKSDSDMISYAKHLSFMGILGGISSNIDQVLLFQYVGPAQLAVYNFAIGIPDQLKGPLKNLDGMLQARFANHSSGSIRENMRNKSLLLLVFGAVCAASYFFAAPYIFTILFPTYMDAVPYSQAYAMYLLSLPFAPSLSYLAAKRLIKEQYVLNVVNSVLRLGLITIGVIGWGLWGLMIAVLAWRFLGGFVGYALYLRASGRESGPQYGA